MSVRYVRLSRFTHLSLENWRNFREVNVDLEERVFIVGPNAAGKTNLLDALRFLREVAQSDGSLVRAVAVRGGIAHLRSLHARKANDVRIQATLVLEGNTWEYKLVLSGNKTQPLRIVQERVTRNGELVLERPTAEDKKDPRLLQQTHLEQLSQNGPFRDLADALASVTHIHVVPQVAKSTLRADEVALREAPGSDFIDQLARLSTKKQLDALDSIQQLLRIAVPQFSELQVVRDDLGRPHLQAKYKHWRPSGSWQNESDFSDGTLRLIGLLWAILHGNAPLLLEEPELSLHREVVRQLPRLIAGAAERTGRQVIVSTHAEEILDDIGVDPREILLLIPTSEETRALQASAEPELVNAARARIPLGKLVMSWTRPESVEQLSLAMLNHERR